MVSKATDAAACDAAQTKFSVELSVAAGEPRNACDLLAQASGLPKLRIKDAMNKGAVWRIPLRGARRRLRRADTRLGAGERLALHYDAEILGRVPPEAQCLADLGDYSVWFKPAGLMTQGTEYGDHCALLRQVERWAQPRRGAWLIHRLDREAAGIVLVAHQRSAAAALSRLFQQRAVEKDYQAEVQGVLLTTAAPQTLRLELDGQPALTEYQVAGTDAREQVSRLRVRLVTGRKHQVRRHFAAIGHPLCGDVRYGGKARRDGGLRLLAVRLALRCPVSGQPRVFDLAELKPEALLWS
jgi:tRNA pseudouridine32 synthase/23S rRNA pseudouridine746 synthase